MSASVMEGQPAGLGPRDVFGGTSLALTTNGFPQTALGAGPPRRTANDLRFCPCSSGPTRAITFFIASNSFQTAVDKFPVANGLAVMADTAAPALLAALHYKRSHPLGPCDFLGNQSSAATRDEHWELQRLRSTSTILGRAKCSRPRPGCC